MSKAIKPIVVNSNESIEVKFPKHGKLLVKKVGKDILIFEEGSETPLAVYQNVDAVASAIELSSLPHFAEASNGIVTDATAPATTESQKEGDNNGIPAWYYVAGGAVALGGIAIANHGGSSNDTPIITSPVSDTTAPAFTSGATAANLDENSGAGAVIYTAAATDSSAVTYTLKSGSDTGVSINSTTGAVTLSENPDYETKPTYNFTVVATDSAGNVSEQAVTFAVTNVDDTAPAFTSGATAANLDENSGAGAVIYTAAATDSSAVTYTLKSGSDTGVSINSTTGAVTLSENPDYETKPTYNFTVVATDSAGNVSEQAVTFAVTNVDDTAPAFTSGATATTVENVATTTAVYTATATDEHILTYTLSGTDAALFDLNGSTGAVTFKTSPNFESPTDNGANNTYDFTIRATDTAGNHSDQNIALSVTDATEYTNIAGDAVIDLGSEGFLINPVHVDNDGNGVADSWFYYWDRNGNGVAGDYESMTHNFLDTIFNHDINGVANTTVANSDGEFGTTNDYRYGTINGVNLALPTTGTGLASETSHYLDDNQIYSDFAEIWDTYNSGYQTNGEPSGWRDGRSYWTATPSSNNEHVQMQLHNGYIYNYYGGDTVNLNVILQVLSPDTTAPAFTSGATATTVENVATTTAVYTATATDEHILTYTLSGTDAALFDLNGSTGAVTFKTSPNFESPTDNGANNTYDFTIRATDTAGNHSDQNIALSVTDATEYTNIAGDAVIDLGSEGFLINPVHIDNDGNGVADSWFYYWDRNGDGLSGTGDSMAHDVLDGLFNHDINGVTNTTVANSDGEFGTTNDYRYGTINGVELALTTSGTGLTNETSANYYLNDNLTYTDIAEIWDTYNTDSSRTGNPLGWQPNLHMTATPSSNGHASVSLFNGYVGNYGDSNNNSHIVALQVL